MPPYTHPPGCPACSGFIHVAKQAGLRSFKISLKIHWAPAPGKRNVPWEFLGFVSCWHLEQKPVCAPRGFMITIPWSLLNGEVRNDTWGQVAVLLGHQQQHAAPSGRCSCCAQCAAYPDTAPAGGVWEQSSSHQQMFTKGAVKGRRCPPCAAFVLGCFALSCRSLFESLMGIFWGNKATAWGWKYFLFLECVCTNAQKGRIFSWHYWLQCVRSFG